MASVKTVGTIGEFLNKKEANKIGGSEVKAILEYSAIWTLGSVIFTSNRGFAEEAVPAMAQSITSSIMTAFDPLIHLIQALSYPIAGVMIAGGCLYIMVGAREKGMDMLRNAGIGYILVQLSPLLLKLLVSVGTGVSH